MMPELEGLGFQCPSSRASVLANMHGSWWHARCTLIPSSYLILTQPVRSTEPELQNSCFASESIEAQGLSSLLSLDTMSFPSSGKKIPGYVFLSSLGPVFLGLEEPLLVVGKEETLSNKPTKQRQRMQDLPLRWGKGSKKNIGPTVTLGKSFPFSDPSLFCHKIWE